MFKILEGRKMGTFLMILALIVLFVIGVVAKGLEMKAIQKFMNENDRK